MNSARPDISPPVRRLPEAPVQGWPALDRAGARVVVIGQVAGIMHGSRELTGDLKRVIDVMHQFLSFPAFDITSMLLGSGQGGGATG